MKLLNSKLKKKSSSKHKHAKESSKVAVAEEESDKLSNVDPVAVSKTRRSFKDEHEVEQEADDGADTEKDTTSEKIKPVGSESPTQFKSRKSSNPSPLTPGTRKSKVAAGSSPAVPHGRRTAVGGDRSMSAPKPRPKSSDDTEARRRVGKGGSGDNTPSVTVSGADPIIDSALRTGSRERLFSGDKRSKRASMALGSLFSLKSGSGDKSKDEPPTTDAEKAFLAELQQRADSEVAEGEKQDSGFFSKMLTARGGKDKKVKDESPLSSSAAGATAASLVSTDKLDVARKPRSKSHAVHMSLRKQKKRTQTSTDSVHHHATMQRKTSERSLSVTGGGDGWDSRGADRPGRGSSTDLNLAAERLAKPVKGMTLADIFSNGVLTSSYTQYYNSNAFNSLDLLAFYRDVDVYRGMPSTTTRTKQAVNIHARFFGGDGSLDSMPSPFLDALSTLGFTPAVAASVSAVLLSKGSVEGADDGAAVVHADGIDWMAFARAAATGEENAFNAIVAGVLAASEKETHHAKFKRHLVKEMGGETGGSVIKRPPTVGGGLTTAQPDKEMDSALEYVDTTVRSLLTFSGMSNHEVHFLMGQINRKLHMVTFPLSPDPATLEKVVTDSTDMIEDCRRRCAAVKIQAMARGWMARFRMRQYSADQLRFMQARNAILWQALKGEREHLATLRVCVDGFLRPMRQAAVGKNTVVGLGDVISIFGNVETLYELHKKSYASMEALLHNFPFCDDTRGLGHVIDEMKDDFLAYNSFAQNFTVSTMTLHRCLQSHKFESLVEGLGKSASTDDEVVDLRSTLLFLSPLGRTMAYNNFLQSLMKLVPRENAEARCLSLASGFVETLIETIRERLRESDNTSKIFEVQRGLVNPKGPINLNQPGRRYVNQFQVHVVEKEATAAGAKAAPAKKKDKEKWKKGAVYLFSDLILVSQHEKGKQSRLLQSVPLADDQLQFNHTAGAALAAGKGDKGDKTDKGHGETDRIEMTARACGTGGFSLTTGTAIGNAEMVNVLNAEIKTATAKRVYGLSIADVLTKELEQEVDSATACVTAAEENVMKVSKDFDATAEEKAAAARAVEEAKVKVEEASKLKVDDRVPYILDRISRAILAGGGVDTQGLFRVSGQAELVKVLQASIDKGDLFDCIVGDGVGAGEGGGDGDGSSNEDSVPKKEASSESPLSSGDSRERQQRQPLDLTACDINVLASALKDWLRELPGPVIPYDMYKQVLTVQRDGADCASYAKLIAALPRSNRILLKFLLEFLVKITVNSDVNMMTSNNLAIVFAPNLLRTQVESVETAMESPVITEAVRFMIDNVLELFESAPASA
eukprot:TRINITY_DN259_c0_g1_i1.p1 TRINITY_DN259_c0_g1~~TRINITY_DN259_c0_g1_i1.p1  ORF type:complete len:1321 (-),score=381.99 TRINITY_DN259_c0_g1_i1:163-4125(-)